MRRKNTKFIDPRYFMDEKMEVLNEGVRALEGSDYQYLPGIARMFGDHVRQEKIAFGVDDQTSKHYYKIPPAGQWIEITGWEGDVPNNSQEILQQLQ